MFFLTSLSVVSFAQSVDTSQSVDSTYNSEDWSNQVIIPPLFEYIIAPEELPDLKSKTDYLMENFWNPMDFKNVGAVDQNALNHAFGVYVQAMQYASEDKVKDSVKKLIGKIKTNPTLTYQFTKAAEENLYGPRAELWGDEIYISFLQNLMDNKKIDDSKKVRYADQLALLKKTAVGEKLPQIKLFNKESTPTSFIFNKKYTLLNFTTPNCEDCRYSFLKMDISGGINDMIEDGLLGVDVILLGEKMADGNLPEKWTVLYSPDALEELDIRMLPSFYIVDNNGKVVAKNLNIDSAIDILEVLNNKE